MTTKIKHHGAANGTSVADDNRDDGEPGLKQRRTSLRAKGRGKPDSTILFVTCVSVADHLCRKTKHQINWRRNKGKTSMTIGLGCSKSLISAIETETTDETEDGSCIKGPTTTTVMDKTTDGVDSGDGTAPSSTKSAETSTNAMDKNENPKKIYIPSVCGASVNDLLSSEDEYDGDDACVDYITGGDGAQSSTDTSTKNTTVNGPFVMSNPLNKKIYSDTCRANKHTHGTKIHARLGIPIMAVSNATDSRFKHLALQPVSSTKRPTPKDSLRVRAAVRQMVRFTNAVKMLYLNNSVYELPFVCPLPRVKCISHLIDELYVLRGSIDKIHRTRQAKDPWLSGLFPCGNDENDATTSGDDGENDEYVSSLCIEDIKTHEESYNFNRNISAATTIKGEMQLATYKYAIHRICLMAADPNADTRSKVAWLLGQDEDLQVDPSALNSMMRLSSRSGNTPIPPELKATGQVGSYYSQTRLLKKRNAVSDGSLHPSMLRLGDIYEDLLCATVRDMLPSPDECENNITLQIRHISHKTFDNLTYLEGAQSSISSSDHDNFAWGDVVCVSNANLCQISEALSSIDGMKLKCLPCAS